MNLMSYIKSHLAGLRRKQAGFTLVELLVVVGIIVALAAVIIPSVAQFANSGEAAAASAEWDAIQTAIDTYMADNALAALPAGDFPAVTTAGDNDWSSAGTLDLVTGGYLRDTVSNYAYCWNATGLVTGQEATPGAGITC